MTASSEAGHSAGARSIRQPRLSVITIFRNEEKFLREAIESVLAQTFSDWELLLVDDGSVDASSQIAKDFAVRCPEQIRYLTHPGHHNLGMSASRNLGIRESKGVYIAFLDGDDVYLPRRLERHVEVLESMPMIDLVQSDLIHWHSWQPAGVRNEEDYVRPCVCFTDRVLKAPLALWVTAAVPELYPGICSLTVRRSVAVDLGGFEEQFRALYEDQVFLTKVYAQKTVYVIEDYLARYRIHRDSTVERRRRAFDVDGAHSKVPAGDFAAWRLRYLLDLPDPTGLLRKVIDGLRNGSPVSDPYGLRMAAAATKRQVRRIVQSALPPRTYRRLMLRRRRMSSERTLAQHERLCEEIAVILCETGGVPAGVSRPAGGGR